MPTRLILRTKTTSRDPANQIVIPGKQPIAFAEPESATKNPWDDAHEALNSNPDVSFAEPEVNSGATYFDYEEEITTRGGSDTDPNEYIEYWPHPEKRGFWHLGDQYSQLLKARLEVAAMPSTHTIRIAHFDTGYSPEHLSTPATIIRKDLERNFVDDEQDNWNSAVDPLASGTLKMPGHGTGTLSILAGTKMSFPVLEFDDYIGLYHKVEIVPIRIAKSVVLMKSSAFVKALDYLVNELFPDESKRVHVVTMSMGGVASGAWADMVNAAYEKGIVIVTAAGNNFNKLPARTLIYPARFNRVIAACGVTHDLSPYAKPKGEGSFSIMEGNYGPKSLMGSSLAAFTPNVPWASYKKHEVVSIRGDGTSSATPQIASAAALYYAKHYDELMKLPEGWMRVEAIRKALFSSAKKEVNGWDGGYATYYGNGILQAADALAIPVAQPGELTKEKEDKVFFPFFKTLFGIRGDANLAEEEMLETELMQLILESPELQEILGDEERGIAELTRSEQIRFAE
ncbi:MAG: S8/S53 family peptidase, partial [Flavitalea sp.]